MLPDLAHWAIRIGRDLIEKHCNSADFGALVAYAGVLAWRERGPAWEIDGEGNAAAQAPPTGWAGMVGTTPATWRRWRDRAIEIGLLSKAHGRYKSGHLVDLLRPVKPYRAELQDQGYELPVEQFARIPCSVLFDQRIGRLGKRALVGIAMYRGKAGFARVAVPTIAKMAGLNIRNTHKGLRSLELAGAIKSTGLSRQIRTYEVCEQPNDRGGHERHQGDHQGHQGVITRDTRGDHQGHQGVITRDTLSGKDSGKAIKKKNQEKLSGAERLSPTNGAKPFRRRPSQNDLVLMRVFEGPDPAPVATADSRLAGQGEGSDAVARPAPSAEPVAKPKSWHACKQEDYASTEANIATADEAGDALNTALARMGRAVQAREAKAA